MKDKNQSSTSRELRVPKVLYWGFLFSLSSIFILPGLISIILTMIGVARTKKFPEIFRGYLLARVNLVLSGLGIASGIFMMSLIMLTAPTVTGYFQDRFRESITRDLRELGAGVKIYRIDNDFLPENLEILKDQAYVFNEQINLNDYSYLINEDKQEFVIKYRPEQKKPAEIYSIIYCSDQGIKHE